jgi:hypothetical protein
MITEQSEAKKSLYIFLSSMLGAMLFLILHRLIVIGYAFLIDSNYEKYGLGLSMLEWTALDYITLMLSLLLGAWYGVWLGIYWYRVVYEEGAHGGAVEHFLCRFWPPKDQAAKLRGKIASVAEQIENEAGQIRNMAVQVPTVSKAVSSMAVKRKVIRKRNVKTA